MQRKSQNGVEWLEFDLFAEIPQLRHGVFLRHGGASKGAYTSLNLGLLVGDDPSHVAANREKVSTILQLQHLAWMRQCHSKTINEIHSISEEPPQGDALTTCIPGIGLMALHADCQAAIIYDPIHHAVANVHAGWRGSVQNIYAETIHFMQKRYHSRPQDLLVGISPSLGPEDAQFINYRKELPEEFWEFQIDKPDYFDFWAISKHQLKQCGILPHHIEIASISTYSNPENYFSYRRSQVAGRHGTIVVLNPA